MFNSFAFDFRIGYTIPMFVGFVIMMTSTISKYKPFIPLFTSLTVKNENDKRNTNIIINFQINKYLLIHNLMTQIEIIVSSL